MNNPLEILRTLDGNLNHRINLVIYGRAAIVLGFNNHPKEAASTWDVDGILPTSMMEGITNDDDFWAAVEKTNADLEPRGLYMTHLFEEEQVILTPDWFQKTVPLNLGLRNIDVCRPSSVDLIHKDDEGTRPSGYDRYPVLDKRGRGHVGIP